MNRIVIIVGYFLYWYSRRYCTGKNEATPLEIARGARVIMY